MKSTQQRILASILFVTMIVAGVPAYAGCGPDTCLGPCTYAELLSSTTFNSACPGTWVYAGSGNVWEKPSPGNNGWAKLSGAGDVRQTVPITTSYSSMELAFDIVKVVATPGTERLYVEVLQNGSIAETVAVIYPNTAQVNYNVGINNYSGSNVQLRFRYVTGSAPGNTVFRVDNAAWFAYY